MCVVPSGELAQTSFFWPHSSVAKDGGRGRKSEFDEMLLPLVRNHARLLITSIHFVYLARISTDCADDGRSSGG